MEAEVLEYMINAINNIGFPIFACMYLAKTNEKILMTIDNRLELMQLKIEKMWGEK